MVKTYLLVCLFDAPQCSNSGQFLQLLLGAVLHGVAADLQGALKSLHNPDVFNEGSTLHPRVRSAMRSGLAYLYHFSLCSHTVPALSLDLLPQVHLGKVGQLYLLSDLHTVDDDLEGEKVWGG